MTRATKINPVKNLLSTLPSKPAGDASILQEGMIRYRLFVSFEDTGTEIFFFTGFEC